MIVQNISSRPEQQQVLAEISADLNIPQARLQQSLVNHPQREKRLRPSLSDCVRVRACGGARRAMPSWPGRSCRWWWWRWSQSPGVVFPLLHQRLGHQLGKEHKALGIRVPFVEEECLAGIRIFLKEGV